MSKIILLNGPKACGKNIAVDYLKGGFDLVDRRCKDRLFLLTALMFGMTMETFNDIYENRELKETPNELFTVSADAFNKLAPIIDYTPLPIDEVAKGLWTTGIKLSVREALIYVSEVVCKPTFGRDYFGKARANDIGNDEWAIDDSCGFDDEIPPTIKKLGQENVMLIRIHGRGSFEGDSRNYISDGIVNNTVDVFNTGVEEDYLNEVYSIAAKFYTST